MQNSATVVYMFWQVTLFRIRPLQMSLWWYEVPYNMYKCFFMPLKVLDALSESGVMIWSTLTVPATETLVKGCIPYAEQ